MVTCKCQIFENQKTDGPETMKKNVHRVCTTIPLAKREDFYGC